MGRKEENIKKAQALLHLKDRIRNIGTAAHIDHGKCLSAESRAWVNGRWVRAGDLWSQFADRRPVPNEYGADVRDVRSDSLWTQSLDLSSGATRFAQITHMWRLRATEPLLEIESRDVSRPRPSIPSSLHRGMAWPIARQRGSGEGTYWPSRGGCSHEVTRTKTGDP